MSIMDKFDKTQRIHRLVFEVRKNWDLRARWKAEFDKLADEYGLDAEEKRAVRECDLRKLHELGVHPFYFNPIIRLTHGEDWDEFQPSTVEIMKRNYGAAGDPETYRGT
jgi:protocatechuate 4,5-dioxygenase alpha chain